MFKRKTNQDISGTEVTGTKCLISAKQNQKAKEYYQIDRIIKTFRDGSEKKTHGPSVSLRES